MQKYKLWIVIALIVLCLITLILWLAPRDEAQARVSARNPPMKAALNRQQHWPMAP